MKFSTWKITVLFLLSILMLSGCTVVWTDDLFYCSLAKEVDIQEAIITDNGAYLKRGQGTPDPNAIKALEPFVSGLAGYLIGSY